MTEDTAMLIQKLRLRHGWSQEQLAELAGLSVRTIQRIERGQKPSAESLKAVAAVLDVDFSSLRESDMTATAASPRVSADETLALARVRRIKGFYFHLVQYGLVIGLLAAVNLLVSPHSLWVIWPALGWGVGLLLHGLRTFEALPFLTGAWERRQVEKRLGREL